MRHLEHLGADTAPAEGVFHRRALLRAGGGRTVLFRDPEGNELQIIER